MVGIKPVANSVYVAIAGVVINRGSLLLRNFVLNGKESASNPLLHTHVFQLYAGRDFTTELPTIPIAIGRTSNIPLFAQHALFFTGVVCRERSERKENFQWKFLVRACPGSGAYREARLRGRKS
ncbi:hypothetical protein [Lunatimonas lonarensis]|uniref:hypothetical protein n=1 Tax=Lunatimonas lonarensis TaxID=1232681 RepID=UPI00055A1F67|nr:hypothetical protein [Lunatimonas lonarensis]